MVDSNALALAPKNFHYLFSFAGNMYVETNGTLSTVDYKMICWKWFGIAGRVFIWRLCEGGRLIVKIRKLIGKYPLEERKV